MAGKKKHPSSAELALQQQVDDLLEEVQGLRGDVLRLKEQLAIAELGDHSTFVDLLPEAEAEIITFVEDLLLRPCAPREAYYLGQMIQGFGPKRCLAALRKKIKAKEPVRAAYAMLQAGASGKPAARKEGTIVADVTYWSLDDAAY